METLKRLFDKRALYILCIMFTAIFWMWIFGLATNSKPERKVCLFADVPVMDNVALSVRLEDALPQSSMRVEARPFSYFMWNPDAILTGDLVLVRETDVRDYAPSFAPLDETTFPGADFLVLDGVPMGIRVYDAAAGTGKAAAFMDYCSENTKKENVYLFIYANSLHAKSLTGQGLDDTALGVARLFLTLE